MRAIVVPDPLAEQLRLCVGWKKGGGRQDGGEER